MPEESSGRTEQEERFAQSPLTGNLYRVTEWDDLGDGKIVAHDKEEVESKQVPDERLCDYCETNLAVEWSDQGKRQCRSCSPSQDELVTDGGQPEQFNQRTESAGERSTQRIGHFFADYGVESEALSVYGEVTRYTLDPEPNPFVDETVQMDLLEQVPDERFDLGLWHPPCVKGSRMTNIDGDPDDYEWHINRARQLARGCCDHWIIENRPEAPLRNPTVFTGKQFGLPIHYKRAFETSFPIRNPPRERALPTECSTYFSADRSKEWWASTKQYVGDYPKGHLVKNCLPAAYVHTLIRNWLRAINERDGRPASDNNGPPPREVADDQIPLTEVSSDV